MEFDHYVRLTHMPLPPSVPAARPASTAPGEVGRDPLLLHVALTELPSPATAVQWLSIDGAESLMIQGSQGADGTRTPNITVRAGASTRDFERLSGQQQAVTVNGHSATAATTTVQNRPATVVRWQVASGLWLQVFAGVDRSTAVAIAARVRLDQVYRCGAPLRLTRTPSGAHVSACSVAFTSGPATGRVSVAVGAWTVTVDAMPGTLPNPTQTLGRWPATVVEHPGDGGSRIMEITLAVGDRIASLTAEGPYDAAVVRAIAEGYTPTGGADPTNWPANPLG